MAHNLFNRFCWPYVMQDRAYPLDIDEALSTNEYVNKMATVVKSVIDIIEENTENIEKLQNEKATPDEAREIAEAVAREHVVHIGKISDKLYHNGEIVTPAELAAYAENAIVILDYSGKHAVLMFATYESADNFEYNFIYSDGIFIESTVYKNNEFINNNYELSTKEYVDNSVTGSVVILHTERDGDFFRVRKEDGELYTFSEFKEDRQNKKNIYLETTNSRTDSETISRFPIIQFVEYVTGTVQCEVYFGNVNVDFKNVWKLTFYSYGDQFARRTADTLLIDGIQELNYPEQVLKNIGAYSGVYNPFERRIGHVNSILSNPDNDLYRRVFTTTQGLAKDNEITMGTITGIRDVFNIYGVIKTTEGSYSTSDITCFVTNEGVVKAKQNFTSYPAALKVIVEYTK